MTEESLTFRPASRPDLEAIIGLLADDPLGQMREMRGPDPELAYVTAFDAILRDENQLLAVAEIAGRIVGCMQISFIPGLSRRGAWRGQLESVRIAASLRGRGLGRQFFGWAIDQCRARGCTLVQLTTDRQRPDALRFYEDLGFVVSHHGLKLAL